MEQEDLNEYLTRKKKIDVHLEEAGWKKPHVYFEVDTKQSDFKRRVYRLYDETFENEKESRYADYFLTDGNGDPLAIIEAKRTLKDPIVGHDAQDQIEIYQYVLLP